MAFAVQMPWAPSTRGKSIPHLQRSGSAPVGSTGRHRRALPSSEDCEACGLCLASLVAVSVQAKFN